MREQNNGLFENLVLREKPDGTYLAKLLQYNITEAEKQLILNGVDVDLNNKISSTVINDSDFISDVTSRIYYSPTGQCYDVTSVYVPGNLCSEGIHGYGNPECVFLQPSSGYYNPANQATAGTTQLVYTEMDCGGGGGGPSGPSDGGGSGGSGPTSPTGPGLPTYEGDDPIPCVSLKNTTNIFKTQLQALKALNQNLSYKGEYGKTLKKENGNYDHEPMNCSDVNYCNPDYGPEVFGGAHTHPRKTDQIFSVFDVFVLYSYYKTTALVNQPDVVFYLVGFGTGSSYAIKINNYSAFTDMLDDLLRTVIGASQNDRIVELEKKLENMSLQNENLPRDFLRFFDTNTFSLYETTDNFSKWNKLTLDPTNPLNTPIKTPCL